MNSSNEKLRTNLKKRAELIRAARNFFSDHGYLEIDTPLRSPAIIPEAHIDPVSSEECFLQASPELYMKRFLAAGCDKLFQICKCFRKNERGRLHTPEFTMLEWYTAGDTYLELMEQVTQLVRHIAVQLNQKNLLPSSDRVVYQKKTIDLKGDWQALSVKKAFQLFSKTTVEEALREGSFDEIISFDIEPELGNRTPAFLYDYPAGQASLARLKPDEPEYAQRFEFYIAGLEIANGFTELTDPDEQRDRFNAENRIRLKNGLQPLPMPERFLADLSCMPESAGIALGIDRLAMIFTDALSIDEVTAFPPESF